jgi:hypothetical protein
VSKFSSRRENAGFAGGTQEFDLELPGSPEWVLQVEEEGLTGSRTAATASLTRAVGGRPPVRNGHNG